MASYREDGFVGLLPKPFQLTAVEDLILAIMKGSETEIPPYRMISVVSDQSQ